jgi:hypothetical protein
MILSTADSGICKLRSQNLHCYCEGKLLSREEIRNCLFRPLLHGHSEQSRKAFCQPM